MQLHIGIDDTDSARGGCTSYATYQLLLQLEKLGTFFDYPNLVRLCPNIPFKTRGNAAVALRLEAGEAYLDEITEIVFRMVEENKYLDDPRTDPAVVVLQGPVTGPLREFSQKAQSRFVELSEALELTKQIGFEALASREGRGLIGALAAVGNLLLGDHTYELIAYRKPSHFGTPRKVRARSVVEMDRQFAGHTFNNLDQETDRILITPRGRDPILCGIRGEDAEVLRDAFAMLEFDEPVDAWCLFRTNQGTDAHLQHESRTDEVVAYSSTVVFGKVTTQPVVGKGGHVFFSISDGNGELQCAAYEPTGTFRRNVAGLIPGDLVRAYGSTRKAEPTFGVTLNLEKIEVVKTADSIFGRNPACESCGRRMETMGRGQGFRCRGCGLRDRHARKSIERKPRQIDTGLYLPPPRAQRHLTKPLSRYGREKSQAPQTMISLWHYP